MLYLYINVSIRKRLHKRKDKDYYYNIYYSIYSSKSVFFKIVWLWFYLTYKHDLKIMIYICAGIRVSSIDGNEELQIYSS